MAKNITFLGASYSDVPAVNLPQTGGGTARFTDASVTTCVESDVTQGKIFIKADGSQGVGTNQGGGGGGGIEITQDAQGYIVLPKTGGGGGGGWTLAGSDSFSVSTTSTSPVNVGTVSAPTAAGSPLVMVLTRCSSGNTGSNHLGTDAMFVNPDQSLATISNKAQVNYYAISGFPGQSVGVNYGGSSYGVYPDSIDSSGNVSIKARYSSSYSKTINDTFTVNVYILDYPQGESVPTT